MTTHIALANTAVIDAAYAAFAEGDIPTILGMLAADVSWVSPKTLPHGGEFAGRDGVLQFFQGIGAKWASLRLTIVGVAELAGDSVVGVVSATGERADGPSSTYGATHVFTIRDGMIASFHEYVDLDGVLV